MNFSDEISKKYGLKISKITILSGGWLNEKYLIETIDGKLFVLKELSLEKFSYSHLPYLIETVKLQDYLYKENAVVPKVIMNNRNQVVSKFSSNKYFFIQEYIEGYSKEFDKLTEEEIFSVGKNLAFLHNKLVNVDSKKFESQFLKFKNIDDLKKELKSKKNEINENSSEKFVQQVDLFEKNLNDIKSSKILEQNQLQLIHGDFTPDNIIFGDNKVKSIIDFELVRINSRLQDIGRIVLSTSFANKKIDLLKLKSFIDGYSTVCKINNFDVINSLKIVWINEFNIWIQDRYFKNYNPPKVEKFINEIMWIGENWFNLEEEIVGVKNMNLKNINYGINIVNKNKNTNLDNILIILDSKYIQYEINKEKSDFINVEIFTEKGKDKIFVDNIEYKTIIEVINKYNIVPKLFSKNLISNKYENELNKLEHKRDIKKSMILKKYNSLINRRFGVIDGISNIYEWYTGAVFFKNYEWNEIDDENNLKKLFLEKYNDSFKYSLPIDTGIILRSYEIYYYFSTNVSRLKKPSRKQIDIWFSNITKYLNKLKSILPTYVINNNYDRRLLLGVVDNLRNIILLLTNSELMILSDNGKDFIYNDSYPNHSLNKYFKLIDDYQTIINSICFDETSDKLCLNLLNSIVAELDILKEKTHNNLKVVEDEFILSKCFNPLREIDNYIENYIVCKSIINEKKLKNKKFHLISILYGSLELPFIIKRLCNSKIKLSFMFQNHGMYLDRQQRSLINIDKEFIEYGKFDRKMNSFIIDDNMMSGVTMQFAYNKLFVNDYKNINGLFIIRHPNVNRIAQLEHFDVALNLDLVDKFIFGMLTDTPYSKIKRNSNLNNMFVNELNIFSIMTEIFLKALYCNNSFIKDSQVDIFKGYSEGMND